MHQSFFPSLGAFGGKLDLRMTTPLRALNLKHIQTPKPGAQIIIYDLWDKN